MAKNAVVFSGRNGLDFQELRSAVVRIPEVTLRLREAQAILDHVLAGTSTQIDLFSVISADDESFFRNIQLKSLVAAIVQVGLFDRYLKTQKRPSVLVGNSNGDSAMLVCAGRLSFKEMVESSQALIAQRTSDVVVPLVAIATPLLSGLSLTEYSALELKPASDGGNSSGFEYQTLHGSSMELKKIITTLFNEHSITRFVNIGPAGALRSSDYRTLSDGEVESVDSIDLDPMLTWFWRNIRTSAFASA